MIQWKKSVLVLFAAIGLLLAACGSVVEKGAETDTRPVAVQSGDRKSVV